MSVERRIFCRKSHPLLLDGTDSLSERGLKHPDIDWFKTLIIVHKRFRINDLYYLTLIYAFISSWRGELLKNKVGILRVILKRTRPIVSCGNQWTYLSMSPLINPLPFSSLFVPLSHTHILFRFFGENSFRTVFPRFGWTLRMGACGEE